MVKCKKCGHSLYPKDKYCPHCRTKVYSWGKNNWIILGVLVILVAVGNLFFEGGSLEMFVISAFILVVAYVFLWFENSPERIEARRLKREREATEKKHLDMIRREHAAAAEGARMGEYRGGQRIQKEREIEKFQREYGLFGPRSIIADSMFGRPKKRRR